MRVKLKILKEKDMELKNVLNMYTKESPDELKPALDNSIKTDK